MPVERKCSSLALFGGSFDPVHNGHLAMARRALEQTPVNEVMFIPAWMPPHKGSYEMTPFSDRLAMLSLAVEKESGFSVSDIEGRRGGYSFTVHTLRDLSRLRGENLPYRFIMGSDTLTELESWKEPSSLAEMTVPLVYLRDGFDPVAPAGLSIEFEILEGESYPVSSTEVRRRVREGLNIEGLVPAEVDRYIEEHGLYRADLRT